MEEPPADTKRLRKGSELEPGQEFLMRLLNADMDDNTKIPHHYRGHDVVSTLFHLYLSKRYGSRCYTRNSNAMQFVRLGLTLTFKVNPTTLRLEESTPPDFVRGLKTTFERCLSLSQPVLFMYLVINVEKEAQHSWHANMVIYRTNTKTFEHFEPHGEYFNNSPLKGKVISDALQRVLREIHPTPFKFVTTAEVCPAEVGPKGFQWIEQDAALGKNNAIEGGGYCMAWSFFFAELCLRNPEKSGREVFASVISFLKKTKGKEMNTMRHIVHSYASRMGKVMFQYFSVVLNHSMTLTKATKLVEWRKHETKDEVTETNMMPIVLAILEDKNDRVPYLLLKYAVSLLVELESAPLANTSNAEVQELEEELSTQMTKLQKFVAQYVQEARLIGDPFTVTEYNLADHRPFQPPAYTPPPAPGPIPLQMQEQVLKEEGDILNKTVQIHDLTERDMRQVQAKVDKYKNPTFWLRATKNVPEKLATYQREMQQLQDQIKRLEKEQAEGQQRLQRLKDEIREKTKDRRPEYEAAYQQQLAAAKQQYDEAAAKFAKNRDQLNKLRELRMKIEPLYEAHYKRVKPVIGGGRRRSVQRSNGRNLKRHLLTQRRT